MDLEQDEPLGHGFDEIEHVVELRDETVDVEAVERRDPGLVQPLDGLVRDPIARALLFSDVEGDAADPVGALEHLDEELGRLDASRGVVGERLEENVVLRLATKHRRGSAP